MSNKPLIPDYINNFHPETPDEKLFVPEWEMRNFSFRQSNQGIARRRTNMHVAQARPQINAARTEKNHFRTETKYERSIIWLLT
jgi:hypothetical protein